VGVKLEVKTPRFPADDPCTILFRNRDLAALKALNAKEQLFLVFLHPW
jgi:hypothetical protein